MCGSVLAVAQGGTGKLPPRRPPPIQHPPIRKPPLIRVPILRISERRVRDIIVLDLQGKITAREGGPALRNALIRLIREGKKKILLNLAKVESIDTTEVEAMVSSYGSVEKAGGELKLCRPTRKVSEQIRQGTEAAKNQGILDLMSVTYENEQDALIAFR